MVKEGREPCSRSRSKVRLTLTSSPVPCFHPPLGWSGGLREGDLTQCSPQLLRGFSGLSDPLPVRRPYAGLSPSLKSHPATPSWPHRKGVGRTPRPQELPGLAPATCLADTPSVSSQTYTWQGRAGSLSDQGGHCRGACCSPLTQSMALILPEFPSPHLGQEVSPPAAGPLPHPEDSTFEGFTCHQEPIPQEGNLSQHLPAPLGARAPDHSPSPPLPDPDPALGGCCLAREPRAGEGTTASFLAQSLHTPLVPAALSHPGNEAEAPRARPSEAVH